MPTIKDLEDVISKIRIVKYGDYVFSDDHNLQTNAITIVKDILKEHDERIKTLAWYGGYVYSDVIPYPDLALNLGLENLRWKNIYSGEGNISTIRSNIGFFSDIFSTDSHIDKFSNDILPTTDLVINLGSNDFRFLNQYVGYGFFSYDVKVRGKPIITYPFKLKKFGQELIWYIDDLTGTDFDWVKVVHDVNLTIGETNFPALDIPLKAGDLLIIHDRFLNTTTWTYENVNWTAFFYQLLLEFKMGTTQKYFVDNRDGFSFYGSPYQYLNQWGPVNTLTTVVPIPDDIDTIHYYVGINCKASYSVSKTIRFRVRYDSYIFLLRPE